MENTASAVKKIALGYGMIYFDFNIMNLDLLADWFGYIMIVRAIGILGKELEELKLIEGFGKVLIGLNVVLWFVTAFYGELEIENNLIFLVTDIMRLTFDFILLTNLYRLATTCECSEAGAILTCRTFMVLIITAVSATSWLASEFTSVDFQWGLAFGAIVYIIFAIRLCSVLFSFSKSLDKLENGEQIG